MLSDTQSHMMHFPFQNSNLYHGGIKPSYKKFWQVSTAKESAFGMENASYDFLFLKAFADITHNKNNDINIISYFVYVLLVV